jgi:glycerate kinase
MAQASGLTLLDKHTRNPLKTTTYGTGELILAAARKGVKQIILGIGGSATNDAGAGMAQALGVRFINKNGSVIKTPLSGGKLADVAMIDCSGVSPLISKLSISIACDVTNLMCGKKGASYVFGPQKGATPEMCNVLDKNLKSFGKLIHQSLGIEVLTIEGGGAAGGLGAGLVAFAGARIERGIDIVINASGIENKIKKADLVITGEGRIDDQTIYGKVAIGIAALAKKYDVPVIAIGGSLGEDANVVLDHGIDVIETCITEEMSIDEAMQNAPALLKDATIRVMQNWKADLE